MARVLHILSQRPSLTGSGITLDAIVRHAAGAGWTQRVVVGAPFDDPSASVGGLDRDSTLPLRFGDETLPFPVPGMSDVMPYVSTRFSAMSQVQLDAYRDAWTSHLAAAIRDFDPELIHCHHIWILASLLKDVAPGIPVLNHCHATGLRQMSLCPHLAPDVRRGCARNERFAVLHGGHAEMLGNELGVPAERIEIVGAGYREELFHARGRRSKLTPRLLFVGKLSAAKGLPQLLDAFAAITPRLPGVELHIAGSGAGEEAEALAARIEAAPAVVAHGFVTQEQLAVLMRQSTVCVLPSFYEGLPLVLVEALATGCRLVATELPGIRDELAPHLGDALRMVALPRMVGIDQPNPDDVPAFVDALRQSLIDALEQPAIEDPLLLYPEALEHFTWRAVFARIERILENFEF